jgi:Ca-activated chloride channel family protein
VGILAVAGSAHVLLPPAVDADIVKLYLSYLDPGVMPVDGGDLSWLVRLLETTPGLMAPGTDILLVTDGMTSGFDDFKAFLAAQKTSLATLTFTALGAQTGKTLGGPTISGDTLTPDNSRLYSLLSRMQTAGDGSSENWIDEYRWLVIPAALLLLFWFRRGVTLYWAPAVIALVLVGAPHSARADVVDWFFTPDQQGILLLKMGHYSEAAQRFNDPGWKAVSCYYAEDWACAKKHFAQMPTEAGVFNMATAAAQGGEYKLARDIFAQLLKINPDYPRARNNYEQLVAIVDEINAMSESQQNESPPPPNEEGKLEGGDPDNIADGAEEKTIGTREVKQLTAAEVLQSEDMTDLWLRDISRDPRAFVRAKFQYEYTRMQETLNAP